jgi:hypothetical protein
MSFIKKYQRFVEELTATAPAKPDVMPGTTEKPSPTKPSPFRRNKPSTEPGTKASAEDVAERFIQMMIDKGESVEKYIK